MRPQLPDYGTYPWWPTTGHQWLHPDSIALARRWIPSPRVFRRTEFDGVFYRLEYGKQSIRVRPTLWISVPYEGFDVGQQVEVIGVGMRADRFVGRISGMSYDRKLRGIRYRLLRAGVPQPRPYRADQLRALDRPMLHRSDFSTNHRPVPQATRSWLDGAADPKPK